MIISKTPYRISFFGGGTDYPDWYLKEGGAVLSTTINRYCYLTCRYFPPFMGVKHRVVWSHIEMVNSISEILHPAVREGLRFLGFDDSSGLEIHHQGDLPARAGIGSSSAFVVGLIHALYGLQGKTISKRELALKAIEIERTALKEQVGSQDQVTVAYGGLNFIQFFKNGDIQVDPVSVAPARLEELQEHLIMLYTGTSRLASEVASKIISNLPNRKEVLYQIRKMVDQGLSILSGSKSLDAFGELLNAGWMLKRELSTAVTNPLVDRIYETAMAHGALGGKLLGAGGAGFMVFYVPPERQQAVKQSLANYLWLPVKFENDGTTLYGYP